MARNSRCCSGNNRCNLGNNKCCCEPKKKNKCEKLEKCLDEMSERDLKLVDCIIKKIREIICLQEESEKFKEKAEFLDEQVEERTKEVECLIRKLREMLEKTNCVCDKTIECHRDDDKDDWDCSDFWNCR